MKVIPIEYYEWDHPGDDGYDVAIDDVSVTYSQNDDEDSNEAQSITISSRNNGAGRYLNIKTNSWSFDSIEQLEMMIDDFKRRALIDK